MDIMGKLLADILAPQKFVAPFIAIFGSIIGGLIYDKIRQLRLKRAIKGGMLC